MDFEAILADEPLPAVVVDLDAFDRNVAHAAAVLRAEGSGQTLRAATKSIRVPELIARILDFGPPYQGLMCFSAHEARLLADRGLDDLLIAYPTMQDADLAALRALHEAGRTVRLMVDGREHLRRLSRFMAGVARPFELVLDVDMSLRPARGAAHLGVRRSPVRDPADVVALFEAARALPDIALVGLMGYEAQLAGLGDKNPFKPLLNPIAAAVRRASVVAVRHLRRRIHRALEERGFQVQLFNGGGTGSLNFTAHEPWLTEVTAGSGFLCSHLFDYYSNIRFEPSFFFALQAVRSSDRGFVTCQGGGYIASGEPGWDKVPVPHHPPGSELVKTEGCGEVQTPIKLAANTRVALGQPVMFRHAKGGELAERFREYLLVSGGDIVARVPTYRGLGECFF